MHPDVGGSEEQMAQLNEAYEVLSDEGASTMSACLPYLTTDARGPCL